MEARAGQADVPTFPVITSLSKVRARAELTDMEVQWDSQLSAMIDMCLDRFNMETARRLQRTVGHSECFDAGALELSLECYPIETASKWEIWRDGIWQEQAAPPHVLQKGGLVRLGERVGGRGELARVTYTGGYVLPDPVGGEGQFRLPTILERAAIETVVMWFQSRTAVGLRSVEGLSGDFREFWDPEWVPWVHSTLRKFRRIGV